MGAPPQQAQAVCQSFGTVWQSLAEHCEVQLEAEAAQQAAEAAGVRAEVQAPQTFALLQAQYFTKRLV